ncbi:MAG: S8 family serine peptidase [Gemmatimonadaceae bacterium]
MTARRSGGRKTTATGAARPAGKKRAATDARRSTSSTGATRAGRDLRDDEVSGAAGRGAAGKGSARKGDAARGAARKGTATKKTAAKKTTAKKTTAKKTTTKKVVATDAAAGRPAAAADVAATSAAAGMVGEDTLQALVAAHPEIAALRARTVVYVHGIGNKPPASVLKCQWDNAVFGFDLAERSRLAYWVNREYYPDPDGGSCASGDVTALEAAPTGVGLSVQQHMAAVSIADETGAVAGRMAEEPELAAIAERMMAAVDATPPGGTTRAGPRAKILPLPRAVREWITRQLVRAFLRDVRDFFYDEAKREAMAESLRERLRVGGGPFVVVAHSQGTMIAYDVLSRLDPKEFQVPLFVTIGSPLGVQEVQDQIRRITGRMEVPACVGIWLNVADPTDPVATDGSLSGEYGAAGMVNDRRIHNLDAPRHPHSGSGYLGHPDVYAAIRAAVETQLFQRVASFTLARDVVRELEDRHRGDRQPVLIELAEPEPGVLTPVRETRDRVIAFLEQTALAGGADPDDLEIQELKRYVAANLTREEAERLATAKQFNALAVSRVWRNAAKHALLDRSADTLQARTAHDGYRALGSKIGWAVLDTGIAPHPHFTEHSNMVAQFDCTVRQRRGQSLAAGEAPDRNGHGSHVAGIIAGALAAQREDGTTVRLTGIAPEAQLYVYKVLDDDGMGNDAWIVRALDHVADLNEEAGMLRIHGVNLSLGGAFDQSVFGCGHSPLCNELRRLSRQGVLVVLAAGNEGFATLQSSDGPIDANMDLSIGDPANLEEAIAVGAVHKENPHTYGVSYFSSRGPTADGRQKPDVVAPGEKILSCRHTWPRTARTVEQLYVEMSGTSMAAPHVSGLLAAFLSVRRQFVGYPEWVKQLLLDNCTDLKRDRPMQGAGLPNLTRMLLNT